MRKGFTLVEVLLVVVVLLVLAGLAFGLMNIVEHVRIRETDGRVMLLGQAVEKHRLVKGFLPATLNALVPKTLEDPGWMVGGKFVDAWGRPIQYRVTGNDFQVWSDGPDGISDNPDDVRFKNR